MTKALLPSFLLSLLFSLHFLPLPVAAQGRTGLIRGRVTDAGAFKDASDNWMAGWTEFDPQRKVY